MLDALHLAFAVRVEDRRGRLAALHRLVVHEAQLGRGVELDAPGELRAQEPRGASQALAGVRQLFLLQNGEENLGVREIRRYVDRGDGHHAHARIAQLVLQEIGQLALDLIA